MRKYKTSHKAYAAWNYDQEVEDLNRKSEEGWQLIQGGCFYSKYEYDPGVVYRYQLDFNTDIENKVRYQEMFQEQGWEYLNSTFNGWHYFRKVYDETLPEEEYEIYTDNDQLPEMITRWLRMVNVLFALISVTGIVQILHMILEPELDRIPLILIDVTFLTIFAMGRRSIKSMRNGKKKKVPKGVTPALFVAALVLYVLMIVLTHYRPYMESEISSMGLESLEENANIIVDQDQVHYTDFYYLDLEMDNVDRMQFMLVRSDGEVIYQTDETHVKISDMRLKLSPGTYEIRLGNAKGGSIELKYSLN